MSSTGREETTLSINSLSSFLFTLLVSSVFSSGVGFGAGSGAGFGDEAGFTSSSDFSFSSLDFTNASYSSFSSFNSFIIESILSLSFLNCSASPNFFLIFLLNSEYLLISPSTLYSFLGSSPLIPRTSSINFSSSFFLASNSGFGTGFIFSSTSLIFLIKHAGICALSLPGISLLSHGLQQLLLSPFFANSGKYILNPFPSPHILFTSSKDKVMVYVFLLLSASNFFPLPGSHSPLTPINLALFLNPPFQCEKSNSKVTVPLSFTLAITLKSSPSEHFLNWKSIQPSSLTWACANTVEGFCTNKLSGVKPFKIKADDKTIALP